MPHRDIRLQPTEPTSMSPFQLQQKYSKQRRLYEAIADKNFEVEHLHLVFCSPKSNRRETLTIWGNTRGEEQQLEGLCCGGAAEKCLRLPPGAKLLLWDRWSDSKFTHRLFCRHISLGKTAITALTKQDNGGGGVSESSEAPDCNSNMWITAIMIHCTQYPLCTSHHL